MKILLIILTVILVSGIFIPLSIIFYMLESDWDRLANERLDLMKQRIHGQRIYEDSNINQINSDENINYKYKEIDAPIGYNKNTTVEHFDINNQDY